MLLTLKPSPELDDLLRLDAWQPAPGQTSIPKMLSFGMVVTNISALSIAAMMVKVVVSRRGTKYPNTGTHWLLRHSFDNYGQFLPGSRYVFSPFGSAIAHGLEAGFVDSRFQQAVDGALEEATQWDEVSMEIDSVLDGTGRLRGKDTGDSFRLFSEWLRVDRDLAEALLGVRDRAGTAAEIAQVLQPLPAGDATSFETRDHYGRKWTRCCEVLLRRLEFEGPPAVFAEAERLQALSRTRAVFR